MDSRSGEGGTEVQKEKEQQKELEVEKAKAPEAAAKKEVKSFTKEEVAKHDKVNDCWMIIHGRVYDVTKFVDDHPGGDIIMDAAGKDGTDMFEDIVHSDIAREELDRYEIGVLKKE